MALFPSAKNATEKKKSQLTSCYWWISLLTHPNHSSPGTVTSNISFSAFQWSSDSGSVLVNSPKARIAGKETSLTMQSLTCFSQESGAHWLLQTHQLLLFLYPQSGMSEMSKLPSLNWRKTVLSEFKNATQNKLFLSALLVNHFMYYIHTDMINWTHAYVITHITPLLHP